MIIRRELWRYKCRADPHGKVIGNLKIVHVGKYIGIDYLKQIASEGEKQRVISITSIEVFIVFSGFGTYICGVAGIVYGSKPFEILFKFYIVTSTAYDYAPV